MKIYFILFSINASLSHVLPDRVINSTVNYTWSSLVFIITVDQKVPYDFAREACRLFSRSYCLQSFEIINEDFNPPYSAFVERDWPSSIIYQNYWINKLANKECNQFFSEIFRRHNHFLDCQG